jgi:glycerol kinase
LAGLASGFWRDQAELTAQWAVDRTFEPAMQADEREQLYAGWKKAVSRARAWAE